MTRPAETQDGRAETTVLARHIAEALLGPMMTDRALDELTTLLIEKRGAAIRSWIADKLHQSEARRHEVGALSADDQSSGSPLHSVRINLSEPSSARFCGAGWSHQEKAGRWTTGAESTLMLGPLPYGGDCLLTLAVAPLHHGEALKAQRLDVSVNGALVGRFRTQDGGRLTLLRSIPADSIADKAALTITMRHPDSRRPADLPGYAPDTRNLAFFVFDVVLTPLQSADLEAVRQLRLGLEHPQKRESAAPPDLCEPKQDMRLATLFESLGDNCEFGFVQRFLGAEPIGLLRFTGMAIDALIKGLTSRFADIAGQHSFSLRRDHHGEYIGVDDAYAMEYHTERYLRDVDEAVLLNEEANRLRYLARKLIDDIEDGSKIFVLKNSYGLPIEIVLRLMRVIHTIGPAVVLWVDVADEAHPVGCVDLVMPGLMRGYIGQFAPLIQGPQTILLEDWRAMMHNARQLWPHAKP